MVGTIVCGIDASGAAAPVADVAHSLADSLGARLVLVHVVEEPAKEAEELVAAIRGRVRVTDDADVRLVEGSPAERLLEAADQESARLLVVGSRGRGAIRSAMLGSVSRTLAAEARCPVVVVPEASDGGAGTSVVCGSTARITRRRRRRARAIGRARDAARVGGGPACRVGRAPGRRAPGARGSGRLSPVSARRAGAGSVQPASPSVPAAPRCC